MTTPKTDELPRNFTDFTYGVNLRQVENLLYALGQVGEVLVYHDGKPAGVLLSVEKYQTLMEAATGVLDS